jgi:hypothetical protein
MFMLDLLDNLPQLRLSDDHLKTIMWIMRECGTPNVPSFSALHKKQAELTHEVNLTTEPHTSALGNCFFMNHPSRLFALVSNATLFYQPRAIMQSLEHRTGQIPMSENTYRYILRLQQPYRRRGMLGNGSMR